MPYIKPEDRPRFDTEIVEISKAIRNVGDFNYVISSLAREYFYKNPSYQRINDIVGVFKCAALEFYRRVAVHYEDVKRDTNGDVY
jgi:hypothetical protein